MVVPGFHLCAIFFVRLFTQCYLTMQDFFSNRFLQDVYELSMHIIYFYTKIYFKFKVQFLKAWIMANLDLGSI